MFKCKEDIGVNNSVCVYAMGGENRGIDSVHVVEIAVDTNARNKLIVTALSNRLHVSLASQLRLITYASCGTLLGNRAQAMMQGPT